ncbi:MAG: ABC transporter substrate-binding protein [Anaerolineae bacterium]
MLGKALRFLSVILMVGILLSGPALAAPPLQEEEPIKIGAIVAITGPASPLGVPERDTLMMLEEKINAEGGLNGRPLKIIIYDTESDETKAVMAIKKLIEEDKVLAVIGPSQTGTTLAVVDTVEKAEIPHISLAAGIQIVEPVKKWVFKTPQTDLFAVSRILDYLETQGISKIAVINVSNAFGESGKNQVLLQAKERGMEVVAEESFGPEDTDMTAQLTRIKASDAEVVICWGTNPGPAMVAKNMMQLGMKIPLLQSHGVANKKFIELAGEAAEGVIFPAGRLLVAKDLPEDDPQKPVLLEYSSMFEEKYGRSADTFGGHAWDALYLLVNAIKKVGTDKEAIRDALENTTGFVGTGGIFNFSPEDHNGLTKDAFVMVKIVNGEWTLLEEPKAQEGEQPKAQ